MRTHALALVLLAAASLGGLVLFDLDPRASATALAALPWIAWAAFSCSGAAAPGRAAAAAGARASQPAEPEVRARRSAALHALAYAGVAAPFTSAGAAFDLVRGIVPGRVAAIALVAFAAAFLPAFASACARSAHAGHAHAGHAPDGHAGARSGARGELVQHTFLALVWLVIPLVVLVLETIGGPEFGGTPAWARLLARASPIAWTIESLLPAEGRACSSALAPILACVLLAALAVWHGGVARRGEPA